MEHEYNEFIESVRYCNIMVMLNSICKQDQDMKNAFDTNTKRVTLPKSFDMDEVNNYSFMSEINIYHKSDCYSLLVIMSYLIEYIRSICAVMVEGTDVSNLSVIFRFKGVDYYGRIGHYGTHTTLIRGDI